MSNFVKFRVWNIEQQCMMTVSQLHFGDDGTGRTTTMLYKKPDGCDGMLVMGENAELMQFTGVFDKNKCEVYEGDIIRTLNPQTVQDMYVGQVVFMDGAFEILLSSYMHLPVGIFAELEVIGNIYEHRHLLNADNP